MSPVSVVSDSTHYLPADLVAGAGIGLVSLYVNEAGGTTRESDFGDFGGFYARLATADPLPTTSQPSVGDFLAVFEPLLDEGRDVVAVLISGGISGTAEAARQAAAEALGSRPDRRMQVIDSGSGCGGLGLVALATAAAAGEGADIDGVVARAQEAKEAVRMWFAVDTLEYLRRGGRIGTAQAWLGGALKIKPILTLDGEITPIERVRTERRAFERMVEFAHELRALGNDGWMVQHIQAPEAAARLVDRARDILGTEPMVVSEIGPVIGTHVGPGLLGIGGLPSSLLA